MNLYEEWLIRLLDTRNSISIEEKPINNANVGGVCNSLNSLEGYFRHLQESLISTELSPGPYMTVGDHLHQAQDLIWTLWKALKDSGGTTECSVCGFEYYGKGSCPYCMRTEKEQ